MKLNPFFIAIVILLSVSCTKEQSGIAPATGAPGSKGAPTASSLSHGLLYQDHSVTSIDLTDPKYYEFNSCIGTKMHILKGIWHIEYNHIYNGKLESIQFHTNTADYKLVDLTTGIEYTGSYASNDQLIIDATNQDFQTMGNLSVLLTTPGKDNNSKLIADYHVKLDSQGNIIFWVDNFRSGCQ